MLMQSFRMTARDWRAGELRFLLVALIVAVASLSAVGFFIDRMRSSLNATPTSCWAPTCSSMPISRCARRGGRRPNGAA
jgi:predicted lysophospholipase L1 biosynthesis ABC-type transport system permease subunit